MVDGCHEIIQQPHKQVVVVEPQRVEHQQPCRDYQPLHMRNILQDRRRMGARRSGSTRTLHMTQHR